MPRIPKASTRAQSGIVISARRRTHLDAEAIIPEEYIADTGDQHSMKGHAPPKIGSKFDVIETDQESEKAKFF
jgi:hypothetical protein